MTPSRSSRKSAKSTTSAERAVSSSPSRGLKLELRDQPKAALNYLKNSVDADHQAKWAAAELIAQAITQLHRRIESGWLPPRSRKVKYLADQAYKERVDLKRGWLELVASQELAVASFRIIYSIPWTATGQVAGLVIGRIAPREAAYPPPGGSGYIDWSPTAPVAG